MGANHSHSLDLLTIDAWKKLVKVVPMVQSKINTYMGVSENYGTPKSSILIGFSIINHPFWGTSTPIFGNIHIYHRNQLNVGKYTIPMDPMDSESGYKFKSPD